MGVYIKGMKMPTDCTMCPLYADEDYNTIEHCNYGWQKLPPIRNGVPDFCPLVPVPPHGRLIDADALDNAFTILRWYETGELAHWGDRSGWFLKGRDIDELIKSAPTIIEAEEDMNNAERC